MVPSSYIHFDDSLWPLLIVRHVGTPTTLQFEDALARRTNYLERGERYVAIHDMSRASGLNPPEHRHMQVAWTQKHEPQLRECVLGVSFVTESAMVRLLISLLLHAKPLPMPHLGFKHMSEAVGWSAELLRRSGLRAESHHVLDRFELHLNRHIA
jgi:hypothetical protein